MNTFVNPHSGTTIIIANGQPRSVKAGSTIADLLQELNVAPTRVVAQLDGIIVSRSEFDRAVLQEGCKLEIVTLVGGG
jgi:sulfur carrier protein